MTGPFEQLAGLDKRIHEPARLAICTALHACEHADFVYLRRLTGLSDGNLSMHLAKLAAAGLVTIDKRFEGRTPRTTARLTDEGRTAIAAYWQQLDTLRDAATAWTPESGGDNP